MFEYFGLLDFSATELIIVLAIVLLLFGSKKLPELTRSFSDSTKEVRKVISGVDNMKREVRSQVINAAKPFKDK